jgi:UDP-N-acetylmuramate dehydrogenase
VDVRTGVRLADLTTLRLGGPADRLVQAVTEAELVQTVLATDADGTAVLVLGGGSNLVVSDDGFAGTVVQVATSGVTVTAAAAGRVRLEVAAGEPWDDIVARTVDEGLAGVEALSGIPGLTGATPIQNVGAYGQEACAVIDHVRVLDRATGVVGVLAGADCRFGYRTSALKNSDRRVVLSVAFDLRRARSGDPVRYRELADALGVRIGDSAPAHRVREAVLALRAAKAMLLDPGDPDTASAGSFFTNPVLDPAGLAAVPDTAPRYPVAGGMVKLSAAWLIEQAGFQRGYGHGDARISSRHTLALTNRGSATTAQLLALAAEVVAGVEARFGVRLTAEPALVGCSLPTSPTP